MVDLLKPDSPNKPFELLLFVVDPRIVAKADKAGIQGFIIDLEVQGKKKRQKSYDTQINKNTIEDIYRVRALTDRPVICRIDGFNEHTKDAIEEVIAAGANEIFLPMLRNPEEVAITLDLIRGRCDLAILVETVEAVRNAEVLGQFPLSRVYIGLNDLAIDRGYRNIFQSVSDGTVETVRRFFTAPFGFGGLTLPELGYPIPCRLLMGEMARLNCAFSFLRRSFYRDIAGKDYAAEVPRIVEAVKVARNRSADEIQRDHEEFIKAVEAGGKLLGRKSQ